MIKSRSSFCRFLAAASVLLCVLSSAKAQDKVLLRLHLHPGQTFDQGVMGEQEIGKTNQNKETDEIVIQQIGFHDEVLNVDKVGTVKLKTTFQSLVMKDTITKDGKVQTILSYDSTKHPAVISPECQLFAGIVGQSVIITISSREKILKMEGIDAIAMEKTADIKVPIVRDFSIGALKDFLNFNSKQAVGMAIFAQPAIVVGNSWIEKNVQSVFGTTQLDVRYTLISRQNGVATITVLSHIKTSLKGMVNGVIRVDEKTGLVISSELHKIIGTKPTIREPKNGVKGKLKPSADSQFSIYSKSTMRRWTVNPLQ